MSLQSKAATLGAFLNGSRQISDHSLFWRRPPAWLGGEWVNRLGLQPLRCAWQTLWHRPDASKAPPELRELAQRLIDDGMIVIPDFLPPEQYAQIKAEYQQAFSNDVEQVESRADDIVNKNFGKLRDTDAVHTAVIRGVRQSSSRISEDRYPATAACLLKNEAILAIVAAALGKSVKYNPGAYFQKESSDPDVAEDTEQNIILHEDVFYSSFKAFYYINDNTAENGAFVAAAGSHRFNARRLRHEYLYSVDIARQKKGKSVSHPKHASGRMQVHGRVYDPSDLNEVQAVGKANTLVIANTMAFHRRGGSSPTERQQVRMCFRHVETLHHRLFPRFGTARAERLKNGRYF